MSQATQGHGPADQDFDAAPNRSQRNWSRAQAKRQREEAEAKERRKQDKKTEEDDFLESVRLLSPFTSATLCSQDRLQWAIEWSEKKVLSKLPVAFTTIEKRNEIFTYLRSCTKTNAICAYFGVKTTSFFKYQKQYRDDKQSHARVSSLSRPAAMQTAGSSQDHAATVELDASAEAAAAESNGVHINMRHSGRQVVFSDVTIQAAKEEFAQRVTGGKRGMTAEAMVEMLIRLRQLHQAEPHEVLPWPHHKTIMAAIENLEAEGLKAQFTNPSRARALEDWRNAINCAAMWWAINDCGIDKSLQFGVDEVSVFLEAGKKPRLMYLPKGMAKACRQRNLAPAAVNLNPKQRMAHLLCMTNAEGSLAATVVKVADHTVAEGKIYLKFVETGMWVAFVNPNVPKTAYSRTILVNCLLPVIHQRQKDAAVYLSASPSAADVHGRPDLKNPSGALSAEAVQAAVAAAADAIGGSAAQQGSQTQDIRLSQFDGGFFRPNLDHVNLPRAVLTFDGAYEQIEAVLSADVAEWCVQHNIGLFKWAAACSLVQQPNDVSRCHKILHRLFASSKYLYAPVKKENIRTSMFPVIAMLNSLPKLAKDSKLTFTKFFCNLHDILHVAFHPDVIRRGWADAGIYPFNVEQIMTGWNHGATQANKSWTMLEPVFKEYCLTAIEKLREPARLGQLLDEVIERVVVREATQDLTELTLLDAMNLAGAGDPEYMKVHITGAVHFKDLNCLLTNAQVKLPSITTGACI